MVWVSWDMADFHSVSVRRSWRDVYFDNPLENISGLPKRPWPASQDFSGSPDT